MNATDLSTGGRFGFNRLFFDPICSDLSRYRVALAVTASSAVPVLLTPVTLENRAGDCGYQEPALPAVAAGETDAAARLRVIERARASYLDRARRRYIHLMDGGISDNLGLRGLYERVLLAGGIENALRATGNAKVRDIVVISVNAQTEPAFNWDLENVSPSLPAVLDAVTSVQINRYNFETVALLQAAFAQWTRSLSAEGHQVDFHFISVSFADLRDEAELRYFNELPTSFDSRPRRSIGCAGLLVAFLGNHGSSRRSGRRWPGPLVLGDTLHAPHPRPEGERVRSRGARAPGWYGCSHRSVSLAGAVLMLVLAPGGPERRPCPPGPSISSAS